MIAHPAVRKVRGLASGDRTAEGVMLGLGALVGLGTGLLAVALIQGVAGVQRVAFGTGAGPVTIVAATTLGGLLVGLLTTYVAPETAGGGVTHVMEAIAMHGGRMRARVVPAKLAASAVSLGTGASGGREGPIVQIGGAVASILGRLLALTEEQKRALIAGGAAAGIAASFNAPIGGMLFAIEVIIGGFRLRYLQVIVVAAVVASVTARELVGEALIYDPPAYALDGAAQLLLYALIGLLAVPVGIGLGRGEHLAGGVFGRLPVWPPLRTALGGLGVGVIATVMPEVLGTGDALPPAGGVTEPIAALLEGELAGQLAGDGYLATGILVVLLVAKLVATALSIGSGASVGSFSPSIFLGAALGGAVGHLAATVAPGLGLRPGAFALAGMAAVLAAGSRAPLTGILIAFELTGGYGLVLPLMLASGIATLVADRFTSDSIYTAPLRARGIFYAEPDDIDILQGVRVGEIMTRDPDTMTADLLLTDARELFRRTGHHGFPVVASQVEPSRLVGVMTVADLGSEPDGAGTVGEVCTRRPLTVTPGDPVLRAVRRMASLDVGRLPVVSEEDHGQLVGLVRRADLVRAYQRAVTRSLGAQQRQASSRLRDLAGTRFVEVRVDAASPAAGLRVHAIAWPPRTVLTSIRRDGEVVMPNGDTLVEPGDEVVALTGSDSAEAVRALLSRPTQP
ncbi:MAG: chloride channel protein [Egibacteraceae bacterium]